MVAGFTDGYFEEIWILEHGGGGHEASAGMASDADSIDIDERVAAGQLLDSGFLVG